MAKVNNSKAKLEAFIKSNEVLTPVSFDPQVTLVTAVAELGQRVDPSATANPTGNLATIPDGYPVKQATLRGSGGLPVQRNETNGLFNLLSRFIKFWSQGGQTTFDPAFGISPGQGYTQGAVLFYNGNKTWYVKTNNLVDTTNWTDTPPNPANWTAITGLPLARYQQGRLTGVSGSPYGDTTGSSTLYFTPTEQGNLISLYDGSNWVTQTFTETSIGSLPSPVGPYEIYIYKSTSATGISIYINQNSFALSNRVQLDGRWVLATNPLYLFVGSVYISGNSIQSWSGVRGIWNLYNQVALLGQAYIYNNGTAWNLPPNTNNQTFAIPTPVVTNDYGTKKIGLLVDPLVKSVIVRYSGQVFGLQGQNRFCASFGINTATIPIHPLVQYESLGYYIRGGANSDGLVTNTINFDFNITDVTAVPVSNDTTTSGNGFTNTNIVGFKDIYRLESSGYGAAPGSVNISDCKGLTIEYWG